MKNKIDLRPQELYLRRYNSEIFRIIHRRGKSREGKRSLNMQPIAACVCMGWEDVRPPSTTSSSRSWDGAKVADTAAWETFPGLLEKCWRQEPMTPSDKTFKRQCSLEICCALKICIHLNHTIFSGLNPGAPKLRQKTRL